jgi:lysophospholipase L1-like esterase
VERAGGRRALTIPLHYLALGDSYTIGTGASGESHSWPAIIASRLGATLTNPAVNGYTTLDLIRDELPLLERVNPDVVSVLIGVNDLVQGRSTEQYRGALTRIYEAIGERKVVAVSIPTWSYVPAAADFGGSEQVDRLTKAFNDVARDLAKRRGLTWIDIAEASTSGVGTQGWVASDNLHPGDAQYAAWAEAIWAGWPRGAA